MYTKLVNTEKLLAAEKNEKSKVDLYLQHILTEIEKKTPEITNQRRDYNRILESHTHLTTRIEQLIAENSELKENLKNLNKKNNDALTNTASLEISNRDLSKQINHLLNNQIDSKLIGYGSSSSLKKTPSLIENDKDSEVVTDHLLTFNNVSELQAKNEQLLKVIRKLSMEQDMYNDFNNKNNDKDDNNSELLNQTLMDINQMKKDRKRMEDMVQAIINDRDLYKAMVEQSDSSKNRQTSASIISSNSNIDINNENNIRITNLENEKKRLLNRISKLETSDKYSTETLDQVKSDCVVLRIQASNSTNELRFQKEITDRLEENLKLLQNETTLSLKRRTELEKIILENQNNLRLKEEKITINNEKIKSLEKIIKKLEIDIEVSKSSETRLIDQISDQRDEIKKQQLFSDSIRRIESSLSSKIEEDKAELIKDKDIQLKNIDELKKQISDRRLITDENIRTSDEELRSLRKQLDDLSKEVFVLKEENTTISGNSKLSQERCNLLEKQLTKEQERNTALQGSQVLDSVIQSELSEKEILLDRANAQIIFLSQQSTKLNLFYIKL
jgi:nucleoprotein TPR